MSFATGARLRLSVIKTVWTFALIATICAPGLAPRPVTAASAGNLPWTPPAPAYRVSVEADGLYRLDYAYLVAAGLPLDGIDAATFRMFYMAEEIPLRVEDGGDGRIDAGDAIYFYGRNVDSLFFDGLAPTRIYTSASVFWLSYGGAPGLRMGERASLPGGVTPGAYRRTVRSERQYLYRSALPMTANADHWFGETLASGVNPGERSYTITDASLPAGSFTARLKVSVQGNRAGPHRLRVLVNGTQVLDDSTSWSGEDLFQPEVDFDQALLKPGDNLITIQLISGVGGKTSDSALTDFIRLTYWDGFDATGDALGFSHGAAGDCAGDPVCAYTANGFTSPDIEVYDVTALTGVTRITSGVTGGAVAPYSVSFGDGAGAQRSYLAVAPAGIKTPQKIEAVQYGASAYTPSDLLDKSLGADYIIITHPDFWTQAITLAKHRGKTYRVAVIDVRQIYDWFNGGQLSAEAIRDFLAYAYANWKPPAPRFVLLFGDGTYDMRNYRGNSWPTFIPPYLELVDPDMGETAADNRFVTVAGADNLPDLAVGRLVANSPADASGLVQKILDYELACQCGSWNYNTLFLSDDLEDGGGNFYAYSNEIADGFVDPANTVPLIPSTHNVQKLYLGQTCDVAGNPTIANECRQQTQDTLNGPGALLMSYVGHSTKLIWASERLMDASLIAGLTNGPCLPINLAMTCLEGFFHEAAQGTASLAEVAVRTPLHGAVASWSPTGLGLVTGHDYLERGLMLALFHNGISELGPAINYAKQYLWDNAGGQHRDLIDTFVLLGDPGLQVKTEAVCLTPTAVTLTNLTAKASLRGVRVTWSTEDERDILGFNVLRRDAASGKPFVALNATPMLAQKAGLGEGASYAFGDASAQRAASYEYMLEVLQVDGGSQQFGPLTATMGRAPLVLPPVFDESP